MTYIKLFEQFINEAVTIEQRDKVFDEAKKWADSKGLKNELGSEGWKGARTFWVTTAFGVWTLDLEAAVKSKGQDSMYRPSYDRDDDNLKWYIKYPSVGYSQYSPRENIKAGNFKTYKTLIERFQAVHDNFQPVVKFLEILGVESNFKWGRGGNTSFSGKNLKDLNFNWSIGKDGNFGYIFDVYGTKDYIYNCGFRKDDDTKFTRTTFDPTTGEAFYYAALCCKKEIEEAGKADFNKLIDILESLKDKTADEVWKLIEKGNWKELEDKYKGRTSAKKFGIE